MKISCRDKDIVHLLGEAFYKIPRFQRPYSWDHANLEELWNDTVVDNDSDYFIGNFVFYQEKDALGVVDGQQRLTTITLMLCMLRDIMQEQGFTDLAKGIHSLIERPNIQNEKYYVLQTETSYPFLQECVQKFGKRPKNIQAGPEEKLIKAACEFLREKLDQVVEAIRSQPSQSEEKKKTAIREELCRIRDKVLSLKVICTCLEDDADAYMIFETLNTRGKDLTLSDLVKSHLYKALRKQIKKENAGDFLDDLVKESEIYRLIHEPTYKSWKKEDLDIRDALGAMELFRIKQQLPMVLAVMRHRADGTLKARRIRDILSAIENFHLIFNAVSSQRSSGGISFMYASAARNLHEAKSSAEKVKVLGALRKKLKSKLPPYAEFEASFLELRCSEKFTKQRSIVRYILGKMCRHDSAGISMDPDRMTIEHLAPENPPTPNGLTDEEIASIGNLVLLDQKANNYVANKPFSEKRKYLKDKKWIDAEVRISTSWTATDITSHARRMAEKAYRKVWTL